MTEFIKLLDTQNNNHSNHKKYNCDINNDPKKLIDNLIISYNIDFEKKFTNISSVLGINPIDSVLFNANNPNNYIDPVILKSANNKTKINSNTKSNLKINTNLDIIKNNVFINVEVNSLKDLLDLTDKYKIDPSVEYNININALHKIKQHLLDLDNMIGMKNLKSNVVDQIIYFMQGLHITTDKSGDFLHTVIYGPPGTGKTEVAKILGKIFGKLGILSKGTFKKVTRSDLIAGYLGQTAIKTSDVIKESLGGVLFIDEAYSLGNVEKGDSFSKECIDTLCEALSDKKSELMVIIAGYENELNECFFSYNKGLDSRFTWRFKTDEYTPNELYQIFLKKVADIGWEIAENSNINEDWFKKNKDYFKYYGRDMETLLAKTKLAHSKRVFCKPENEKRKITLKDLDVGMQMYLNNDEVKKRKDRNEINRVMSSMYI